MLDRLHCKKKRRRRDLSKKMLLKEYRICMPLTVEEVSV